MKKRTFLAAALALLLLLTLCPAALAMGYDLSSIDWLTAMNGGFSLKDYLDGSQQTVSIAGTPVDLAHLLFAECAVDEELELCLCEATRDARVLDESVLPEGCRVEVRQEALRRPDAKTGNDIVEEKKREAQGLDAEPEETLEPLPDDGQEHFYLYLVGKPTRLGSYAFLIWTDQFYYCSAEVVPAVELPYYTSEITAFSGDQGTQTEPSPTPEATVDNTGDEQEGEVSGFINNLMSQAESVIQATQDIIDTFVTDPPAYTQPTDPPVYYQPTDPPVIVHTLSAPTVTIAGDTSCRPGERAILEARASGENLSYQWYRSLGAYSSPIEGATNSYYIPDTSQAGTYGYFCRVTSSGYGQQVYTDSEAVLFNVVERQLSSVSIDTMPSKLSYTEGQALDTSGLRLLLRYNDGSAEYATSGFTAAPTTLSTVGNVNVLVNYKGFNVGYTVSVISYQDAAQKILDSVRGIGVLTAPYKTNYKVGETLNTDGLSIRAYTSDGSYFDVDWGLNCSPTYFNGSGRQTVTVSFAGKTCTFSVNVEQDNRVTGLWVQNMPANRSYTVGDSISTSGLTLQVRTNSGTQTVTSGYSISPQVATTPGTQTITVSYGGASTSYTVNVREAQTTRPTATPYPYQTTSPYQTPSPYATTSPYATPTPSPAFAAVTSPAPSATPTPSAQPSPVQVRKNTGVSSLVKILFVVAVVALAALIAYVLYLRKQSGDEEDYDREPRPSEKLHDLFSKKDRRDR